MKNFCITISLVTFILLSACKKNTTTQQPPATPVTITPLSDTTKYFYAMLQAYTYQNISIAPTYVANNYSASAFFSYILQQTNTWYTPNNVNQVKVNNAQLSLSSSYTYYQGNLYAADSTANWYVVGNNNLPPYSFTNSGHMPSYNYLLVPDSVNRTQDFTLPVNPTRTKTFEVYIKGNGVNYNVDTVFTLTTNQTSVTIPAAKLHNLANDYNPITITQTNYNPQSVNGMPVCFMSIYVTKKPVYFK